MPVSKTSTLDKRTIKNAFAKWEELRDESNAFGESTPPSAKANVCEGLLAILPVIQEASPKSGKSVRGRLRSLGHYISRDGYTVKFAKPARKASRKRSRKASQTNDNATNDSATTNDASQENASQENANA